MSSSRVSLITELEYEMEWHLYTVQLTHVTGTAQSRLSYLYYVSRALVSLQMLYRVLPAAAKVVRQRIEAVTED